MSSYTHYLIHNLSLFSPSKFDYPEPVDLHSKLSAMPILIHKPISTAFPFRSRRTSSPTHCHHHQQQQQQLTDANNHQLIIKPSSASLTQIYKQKPGFSHLAKLHANMSSSSHCLASSSSSSTTTTTTTLNPTIPSNRSNSSTTNHLHPLLLPPPLEISLSWESLNPTLPLSQPRLAPTSHLHSHPTHRITSPSLISIDHHSDSSSHLTLTSEPSSNTKTSNSHTPWPSHSPTPDIELNLSYNSSPSLFNGLSYCHQHSDSRPTRPPAAASPVIPSSTGKILLYTQNFL